MKAMILAAGLGTRLKPFTNNHPKALYVVDGKTLLEHAIDHLKSAGIQQVIINVHHFAGQIVEYLRQHDHFGLQISISDETGELLETGGGVKKAGWFFQDCDCAIIRNVDIISDLDLVRFSTHQQESGALATLAVRKRETSRYFLFKRDMQLCGWVNRKTGERILVGESANFESEHSFTGLNPCLESAAGTKPDPAFSTESIPGKGSLSSFAFSGIQALSPEIFPLIHEEGKFSLTNLYLRLAKNNKISGYLEDGVVWKDAGSLI